MQKGGSWKKKKSASRSRYPNFFTGLNISWYKHAYLEYDISMIVKSEAIPVEKIRTIIKDQNGIFLTSDPSKHGIPRTYFSVLEKKGKVQHISRGVYLAAGFILDEMDAIQARYRAALFSHETAVFLLGLADRSPLFYSVTVPSG